MRRYLTDGDESLDEVKIHTSKRQRVRIKSVCLETGEVREFRTQSAAAKALGVNISSISQVSRGLKTSAKGYTFTRI